MAKQTKWGILGPGRISHKFAAAVAALPDGEVIAVGSRSAERAAAFAGTHGIANAHGSYAELAVDSAVDMVYVSSPHVGHADHACLCLEAGKGVLCEKPMFINAAGVQRMRDCAQANGQFLMEAMWTRFLPVTVGVRKWLADGLIGDVRSAIIDFGFRCGWDPESRLLNPDLAGGGLLDVGVYTISYSSMIFGTAASATGFAHIGDTGVDEQASVSLCYPEGKLATLFCSVRTSTPHTARICGTDGQIFVEHFWNAPKATLTRPKHEPEVLDMAHEINGFEYEIREVHRCLGDGLLESPDMPVSESLGIAETMDQLRAQWGLKFPME
jgi:dihydrodiol dehydrogenase / D-xylose 1-dehydrogenase (NADP)